MKKVILVSAVCALLCPVASTEARDNKVSGGLSTGYDYYDRQDKGSTEILPVVEGQDTAILPTASLDEDEDDYERIFVRPMVMLETLSERDSLQIRYEPTLYYDTVSEDQDVNHNASLSAQRLLTQKWRLQLNDNYALRDDAAEIANTAEYSPTAGAGDAATGAATAQSGSEPLSSDQGRRRYTTNDLQVISEYTYREDSIFSLGYTNSILRNDDDENLSYQDYDRHDAMLSLGYRFNPIWKTTFSGHYVRGLFETPAFTAEENAARLAAIDTALAEETGAVGLNEDPTDDVTEYHAAVGLEYSANSRQPLSLEYSLASYDYDWELYNDTDIHNLTLGWQWQYSPQLSFRAGAGPTYIVTENQDDTWGANANLGTSYQRERSSFSLDVQKGYGRQNFSGQTIDNGLVDYWDGRATFSYQLLASTSVSLFAGYRYEDQDELVLAELATGQSADSVLQADTLEIEAVNSKRFMTGCSLAYSFWQWYGLDLRYTYSDQVSDRPDDEYDEHQVMLTLSFAKDFFRW